MSVAERSLRALRSFPATLEDLIEGVPSAALDWRPPVWDGIPSESLTIRRQICHLRDIEADGYFVRFTRILGEENPELESIDGYALIEARDYDRADAGEAFADFRAARGKTLRLLETLTPEQFVRRGRFEGQDVTAAGLVHFLCSHDAQHLAGIDWLLGRYASAPA